MIARLQLQEVEVDRPASPPQVTRLPALKAPRRRRRRHATNPFYVPAWGSVKIH